MCVAKQAAQALAKRVEMRIEVTERCIREGRPRSCTECPVAKAVQLHLPIGHTCSVDSFGLQIKDKIGHIVYQTSHTLAVYSFITAYDYGGSVSPFSFELELKW